MKQTKLIILLFFIITISATGFAEQNLNVRLRSSKTVFFHEKAINIDFMVSNDNSKPYFLKISDFSFINYNLEIYTLKNVSIKEREDFFSLQINLKEKLKTKYKNNKLNLFKDILLIPSQLLGHKIDISKYYDLKPGIYVIRGKFYPYTSFLKPKNFIYTPRIKIIVKENPEKIQELVRNRQFMKKELDLITTPDRSIQAFFEGKIKKEWNKFFYVVDLRRMIKQFPIFSKSFKEAADNEKNEIVNDFKKFLKQLNSDEKIISYEILETVIRKNKAISKIILKSRFRHMIIKREYRIGLLKKDHWYIYGYTVIQK